jgi:hypothetical protein
MSIRRNHGFSRYLIDGEKVTIFFEDIDNKKTICHLILTEDGVSSLHFVGKAKLDPRDTFDRAEGEKRALIKAITKCEKYHCKMLDRIIIYQGQINFNLKTLCLNRLDKIHKKG